MRKNRATVKITVEQLEAELKREKYKRQYSRVLRSTIYSLVVVAAVAVLVAVLLLPVLQIYGNSMSPTLKEGNIVVAVKGAELEAGDLVSFYLGNKLLVKRYIAGPGEWVYIDRNGNVFVSDTKDGYQIESPLEEPYLIQKALGDCNIEFPYQVPEDRIFVLGDKRETSADSRNTTVGCIAEEQIVGKIVFRIWPINQFGTLLLENENITEEEVQDN